MYFRMCAQVFREECGLYQRKVYCFVPLSIQECLTALYVFLMFNNVNVMAEQETTPNDPLTSNEFSTTILHKSAVYKALKSEN